MPALLTLHTWPALSVGARRAYAAKGGGIQMNQIPTGRCEVTKVDLGLPFGLSEKLYRKKCREVFARLAEAGERYVCLPERMKEQARAYGLQPCDPLPALRRLAAGAVFDCLGKKTALGHAHVYARMPSREVIDCVHALAERCRYVSVSGGAWAERTGRMLLREYGTAAPGGSAVCRQVTAAFDAGYGGREEDTVIDLTREGIGGVNVIRPRLELSGDAAERLRGGFCDPGPLWGHLYIHGVLARKDLRIRCGQGPES